MTRRLKKNKAFTLIELIVVIAILGVIVLLAAPKFLGYTEDAKLVQIKNDVKVIENALEIELIEDPEYMVNKEWGSVILETMNGYVEEGSLFDTKGSVDGELGGEFYLIQDELAKTNLKGQFIADKGGKVYYHEEGFGEKGEDPTKFTVTFMDIDGNVIAEENIKEGESVSPPEVEFRVGEEGDELEFDGWDKPLDNITEDITVKPTYKNVWEWVSSTSIGTYYKNDDRGYFKYVGTGETTVEIPHEIQGVEMTSYFNMFRGTGEDVKKVISTNERVTNMSDMFRDSKATTLDLSSFNTSSVRNMSSMFFGSQATTLDLNEFDTSSVTNMRYMFRGSQATSLDLSKFNTSSVTNMSGMFINSQATTLDLSKFNTSSVTNMGNMFESSQAKSLDLSNWNTSSVTNMGHMFNNSQATTLDLSSFNTSKVTNMLYMFNESKATTLDLSEFDTENVTSMNGMFRGSQAESIIFGDNFDTSSVTTMSYMFDGSQATTLDLSNFDTSSVEDMNYMFRESKATTLDLSNFDTSNVTDMYGMFYQSQATTGYAKSEADADRLNVSSDKPSTLNFIVK